MFDAKEWLRSVRDAAQLIDSEQKFEQAQQAAALSFGSSVATMSRSMNKDVMAQVDTLIDLQQERANRLESAYIELANARQVFEGMSKVGKLEYEAARVLELNSVNLMSLKSAASALYVSLSTVKRRYAYGVDWLNAHGLAHAKSALGIAT